MARGVKCQVVALLHGSHSEPMTVLGQNGLCYALLKSVYKDPLKVLFEVEDD